MTPKEARRLWVEALRSGEYKQGYDVLRNDDTYCCLGVACDVFRRHNGGEWRQRPLSKDYAFFDGDADASICALPDRVQEWLGLRTDIGAYKMIEGYQRFDDITALTGANDSGYSFDEIADIIEAEPKGLLRPQVK